MNSCSSERAGDSWWKPNLVHDNWSICSMLEQQEMKQETKAGTSQEAPFIFKTIWRHGILKPGTDGSIWQYRNRLEGLGMRSREKRYWFLKLASEENNEPWMMD